MTVPENTNIINDARMLLTDTVTSGLICAIFGNNFLVSNEKKITTYSYFSESSDSTFSFKVSAEYPDNCDSFNPNSIYIREIEFGPYSTDYHQYFFRSMGAVSLRSTSGIDIDFLDLSDEDQKSFLNRTRAWSTASSPNDLIELNKRLLDSEIC